MIHGQSYDANLDAARLGTLLERVRNSMLPGNWVTLRQLAEWCGGSEAGVSARLRELRNDYRYDIQKKRSEENPAIWFYRLQYRTDKEGNGMLPGMA